MAIEYMKIINLHAAAATCLIILLAPALAICQTGPIGWASVNANGQYGTTGGEGGETIRVTDMNQLINAANQTVPLIIQVEGMITLTPKGRYIEVRSDKTIIGLGAGAGISQGGFRVGSNTKNVIFKNLTISDTYVDGDWDGKDQDWDGIQIKGTCHHIWVDHCTFLRQGDGALDITNGANYVTVSHCLFGANNKISLIGSSDTDSFRDRYKVTMHHNWFNETTQRNPRVRFGMVHLFNNYYYNMGGYGRSSGLSNSNGYAIGIGVGAQIYSEHNYFERVMYPTDFYDTGALPGYIVDKGSYFVQSGFMQTKPDGINWNPADFYDYTLDAAGEVKEIVMSSAGAEQIQTHNGITPVSLNDLQLNLFPNPFSTHTYVSFHLPDPGIISLTIIDITGRVVYSKTVGFPQGGLQKFLIQRENLKGGVYFLQAESGIVKETTKMIIY
jgi:pectate lyase